MNINITPNTARLLTGIAIGYVGALLVRWLIHESAEMKREEANKAANPETKNFTADESRFMNYVDEGFMGVSANENLMMVGGGKPIEFANATGKNPPLATDEPNFAYFHGTPRTKGQMKRYINNLEEQTGFEYIETPNGYVKAVRKNGKLVPITQKPVSFWELFFKSKAKKEETSPVQVDAQKSQVQVAQAMDVRGRGYGSRRKKNQISQPMVVDAVIQNG
jgi:hypothetical protein